jgi:IclR helix-turn-helix domain
VSDEKSSISVTLSAAQVDQVVRAASQGRAPSIATLVTKLLSTPLGSANGGGDAGEAAGGVSSGGYLPADHGDPRLSRSLLRGLSLLTCFGPDGAPRGIVELAHDLGMSPSTAHRYAATLVELGLLDRCPTTRKYKLPEL